MWHKKLARLVAYHRLYNAIENTANQSSGKPMYIRRYYIQPFHYASRLYRIGSIFYGVL